MQFSTTLAGVCVGEGLSFLKGTGYWKFNHAPLGIQATQFGCVCVCVSVRSSSFFSSFSSSFGGEITRVGADLGKECDHCS